ncbi:MAG: MBL fold metallo-hydrolase [Bryobacter sp.]|nr:MBL fold metallo-hydrolase [Bryobacter sp.]
MKLTFWGAAQTVTGSMHELTVNGSRILLDCGLYQGRRKEAFERNRNLPVRATDVDAVCLSHAHMDHSGNLPSLVRAGFTGPIFSTPATAGLCDPMLKDSAHIQLKDAEFVNKRKRRRKSLVEELEENGEVEPLYSPEDAEAVLPLFRRVRMHTPTEVAPGVTYETVDAGHMLGSTSMVLTAKNGNGTTVRLGFSGDIGRKGLPITRDPETMPPVDYLIMESTYGDRLHQDVGSVKDKLASIIQRTAARGGRVITPSFAVGRTQQIVIMLHELQEEGRLPNIPVYVDSPLAIDVTQVFREHPECFDEEALEYVNDGEDPFKFARLRYIRESSESKALNELHGPMMIISSSGMCEAGRILHHLRNNISDPKNTVLITGFQAENTLGRKILEKYDVVPIFGDPVRLRAEVHKINELSGHADQRELLGWLEPLAKKLKRVFLVHGEPSQSAALARAIEDRYRVEVTVPKRGESFSLS